MDLVAEFARLLGGYQGSWQSQALCREMDNDIFFPKRGSSAPEAFRVCAKCPVTFECLEFALETDQRHGIWGGKSASERSRIKVIPKRYPESRS